MNYTNPRSQLAGLLSASTARIFRPDAEHNNDNLRRIIVCKNQKKKRDNRSHCRATQTANSKVAGADPRHQRWACGPNGQSSLFQVGTHTRFEVRAKPLGV